MAAEAPKYPRPFQQFVQSEARQMYLPVTEHTLGTFSHESVFLPFQGINSTGLSLHIIKKINEGKFGELTHVTGLETSSRPSHTGLFVKVQGDAFRAYRVLHSVFEVISHETSLQLGTTLYDVVGEYSGPHWLDAAKRNLDEFIAQNRYTTDRNLFSQLEKLKDQNAKDEEDVITAFEKSVPYMLNETRRNVD